MLESRKLKIVSGQNKGTFDIFTENQGVLLATARPGKSLLGGKLTISETITQATIFQSVWSILPIPRVEIHDATKTVVGWFLERSLYHPSGKIWAHREDCSKDHFQWLSNGLNLICEMKFSHQGWEVNFKNQPVNPFVSMNILGNAFWLLGNRQ